MGREWYFPGWGDDDDDYLGEFFTVGSDPKLFDESPSGYFLCVVSELNGKIELMDGGGSFKRFPAKGLSVKSLAKWIVKFDGLDKRK